MAVVKLVSVLTSFWFPVSGFGPVSADRLDEQNDFRGVGRSKKVTGRKKCLLRFLEGFGCFPVEKNTFSVFVDVLECFPVDRFSFFPISGFLGFWF